MHESKQRDCLLIILCMAILFMSGAFSACNIIKENKNKIASIDYCVVEENEIPDELKKLIDERKNNTTRLTFVAKDYTYIVAGYGTQKTSGYSIRVNDVYLGTNAVCIDVDLIGPGVDEPVTELPTTPYIVIRIEKNENPVIFMM